jgi:hypothetical protein
LEQTFRICTMVHIDIWIDEISFVQMRILWRPQCLLFQDPPSQTLLSYPPGCWQTTLFLGKEKFNNNIASPESIALSNCI